MFVVGMGHVPYKDKELLAHHKEYHYYEFHQTALVSHGDVNAVSEAFLPFQESISKENTGFL